MKKPLFSIHLMGLLLGALAFIGLVMFPPPEAFAIFLQQKFTGANPADLARAAVGMQRAFAVLVLMVIWWLTEALPIPVTALVPAVVGPFLHLQKLAKAKTGDGYELVSLKTEVILSNYADNIVFLFFGGYLLAAAMTYQGLDRRITFALLSLRAFAKTPVRLLLGLMGATAFVSMWMNNTSVTAMMMPIGVGIATSTRQLTEAQHSRGMANFSVCIALGIAYAASIGGVATIVGSTPNGMAVSMLRQSNIASLTFGQWIPFGLPIAILVLLTTWFFLPLALPFGQLNFADIHHKIAVEKAKLGPMGVGEKRVLGIFVGTATAWMVLPFLKGNVPPSWDYALGVLAEPWVVALAAAVVLFIVPQHLRERQPLITWSYAQSQTDWGSLVLFGGGLAMSKMLSETYAVEWVAQQIGAVLGQPSLWVMVLCLALFVNLLTEITSNTAVAAMMIPLAISLAQQSGLPVVPVIMAIAMSSSMAFMLPIATPPNAIAYSTGLIGVKQMARVGFLLNIVSTIVIVLVILWQT